MQEWLLWNLTLSTKYVMQNGCLMFLTWKPWNVLTAVSSHLPVIRGIDDECSSLVTPCFPPVFRESLCTSEDRRSNEIIAYNDDIILLSKTFCAKILWRNKKRFPGVLDNMREISTVPSPPGSFGGLISPKQSSNPLQIEIWNTINQWNFCQVLMSSPPCTNVKPPYWRLSGDGSESV